MGVMNNLKHKIEEKLGDHPNASSDPNINPSSWVKDSKASRKSSVQDRIEAGQGYDPEENIAHRAGSTTSANTVSAGVASGTIARGDDKQ